MVVATGAISPAACSSSCSFPAEAPPPPPPPPPPTPADESTSFHTASVELSVSDMGLERACHLEPWEPRRIHTDAGVWLEGRGGGSGTCGGAIIRSLEQCIKSIGGRGGSLGWCVRVGGERRRGVSEWGAPPCGRVGGAKRLGPRSWRRNRLLLSDDALLLLSLCSERRLLEPRIPVLPHSRRLGLVFRLLRSRERGCLRPLSCTGGRRGALPTLVRSTYAWCFPSGAVPLHWSAASASSCVPGSSCGRPCTR